MTINIINACHEHDQAINDLLEHAFGVQRHQRAINQRRKGLQPMAQYCFVGFHEYSLIASIRFYACVITDNAGKYISGIIPFLGPLAVHPDFSNQGIGKKISFHALDILRANNVKATMLIGDAKRYQNYGFDANIVKHIDFGDNTAPLILMGLEFEQGYLADKQGNIKFIDDI